MRSYSVVSIYLPKDVLFEDFWVVGLIVAFWNFREIPSGFFTKLFISTIQIAKWHSSGE